MTLYFTYDRHLYDMGIVDTHAEKRAILRPNAEGKYQIVRIEEAEIEAGEEPAQETAPPASTDEQSVDAAYAGVLDSVKNGERAYQFTDGLDYSRGTGMYECSRITLENNAIKLTDMPEYRFQLGDSAQEAFAAENPDVVWIDLI